MSSRSLFRLAIGSILLGSCVATAQAQRGGAYPMNVEDRINAITVDSDPGYDAGGRSATAAGAYPMNTMDRINSAWRANSRERAAAANTRSRNVESKTSVGAETLPALKDRPDAWRYRWHRNQWWYYGANNQWSYWMGDRWNAYQSASAAQHDATGAGH